MQTSYLQQYSNNKNKKKLRVTKIVCTTEDLNYIIGKFVVELCFLDDNDDHQKGKRK